MILLTLFIGFSFGCIIGFLVYLYHDTKNSKSKIKHINIKDFSKSHNIKVGINNDNE